MITTRLHSLPIQHDQLLDYVEMLRVDAARQLTDEQRAARGQYFTQAQIAAFMASLFSWQEPHLRLIDAGAGVGSLSAAFVSEMARQPIKPASMSITAYEVDPLLITYLRMTLVVRQGKNFG